MEGPATPTLAEKIFFGVINCPTRAQVFADAAEEVPWVQAEVRQVVVRCALQWGWHTEEGGECGQDLQNLLRFIKIYGYFQRFSKTFSLFAAIYYQPYESRVHLDADF
jgi:hypothetical protein